MKVLAVKLLTNSRWQSISSYKIGPTFTNHFVNWKLFPIMNVFDLLKYIVVSYAILAAPQKLFFTEAHTFPFRYQIELESVMEKCYWHFAKQKLFFWGFKVDSILLELCSWASIQSGLKMIETSFYYFNVTIERFIRDETQVFC